MEDQKPKSLRSILIYVIAVVLAASTFAIWYSTIMQWPSLAFSIKTDPDRLIIDKVSPDGPGDKAGLQTGDVIIELGSIQITPDIIEDGRWFWNGFKNGTLAPKKTTSIVIERQGERVKKPFTPTTLADSHSSRIEEIILFLLLSILGFILLIKRPKSSSYVLAYCLLALAVYYAGTYYPR